MTHETHFIQEQGIFVPRRRPHHRNDEYDEAGFSVLIQMQREHFWYRGRHKLLLNVLKKEILRQYGKTESLRVMDMGGGCGGWLEYLHIHNFGLFQELALGDSSMRALSLAEPVVGSFATRYQLDLLDLDWREEWDIVFLLDVLEHIPDHEAVLRQVHRSMRPGGLLFVTTPALKFFWTYNDELAHHQRRYSKQDFRMLGKQVHLELLRTEYFMFFLSPALLFSRILFRPPASATPEQRQNHLTRTHRIPAQSINELFTKLFSLEAAMVNFVNFPWGTSILAVFKRWTTFCLERPPNNGINLTCSSGLLSDYKVNGKKSLPDTEARVRLHLRPFFGHKHAHEITSADVQAFVAHRKEENASNAEVNRELAALKRAFNLALQAEKITRKPYFPCWEEDNARQGFFEPWEFEAVLAQLPEHLRPPVTWAYDTGWRIYSEILPLTWDRVDLEAGTVRLYRGTTQNKDGRVIALPQVLKDILEQQWREHIESYPGCPFVFHENGREMKSFYKTWRKACTAAGISDRKLIHDCRRTAVRNLVRAGVPERIAMIITGHKTRDVFDRYNIVSAGDLEEAARRVDERIAARMVTKMVTIDGAMASEPC
jgi:integrase/2-polyprenyl-3-methyl-5-hydroxy-6-metoxy-1,4-benzoquinol methylase